MVEPETTTTESSEISQAELLNMSLDQARIPKLYRDSSWENFDPGAIESIPNSSIRKKIDERLIALRTWRGDDTDKTIAFLTGGPGRGKTHLAAATLRRFILAGRRGALFIVVGEWLQAMKDGFSTGGSAGVMNQAKGAKLLALDDIGSEMATDWVRDALYTLINYRINNLKPTIVTSNLRPSEIAQTYHERLASRLASGLVVDLSVLTDQRIT